MKFQITRAQTIDTRHSMPSPMIVDMQTSRGKSLSQNNLRALLHKMFKILTHEERNSAIRTENKSRSPISAKKKESSIEHLENCANAARQTEAYDQYE